MTAAARARLLLLVAFFASGTTGLVYEMMWTRVVSTWFGVSAYAISTVLAAFLGGLAAGGALAGRWLKEHPERPALRDYALVEVGVAVCALLLQAFFAVGDPLLEAVARSSPGLGVGSLLVRFVTAATLLAPPTLLMGATFPLLAHGLAQRAAAPRRAIEAAYGVNVLGAAVGCAGTAWGLLPGLGVTPSIALAAGVNLAVAGVAWALAPRVEGAAPPAPPPGPAPSSSPPLAGIASLVGIAGFTAMASEVVWSRVFRFVLGVANPYHAFALTLTLILSGMAVGALGLAALPARRAPSDRGRLLAFAAVQAGLALLSLVALASTQQALWRLLPQHRFTIPGTGLASLAALALLLGLGFPLLASIQADLRDRVGPRVGTLYAVSTVAGVLGSLVGGFALLPLLGARVSLLILGGLNAVACALALGWVRPRLAGWAAVPLLAVLVASVTSDDAPYFLIRGQLLYLHDGVEATTAVTGPPTTRGNRMLQSNGVSIDGKPSAGRATVPMSLAQDPEHVLLIGFGTGLTAAQVLRAWPDIRLDCVELDDNQAETARYFGTQWLLEDDRFSLAMEDGRQFLLRQTSAYDVIIVDTWGQAINQEFYNADFFAEAARALTDDGLFYIKLPTGDLAAPEELDVMLRSAHAGLPQAYVIPPVSIEVFPGLVGSRRLLDLPPLPSKTGLPTRMRSLYASARGGIRRIDDALVERLDGGRVNSDERPWFFKVSLREPGAVDAYLNALLADDPPEFGVP